MDKTSLETPGEWLEFTIWGRPRGYIRRTRKGRWTTAARQYHEWMREVQAVAQQAGLKLPLQADEGEEIMVRTFAVFPSRTHPDPENVQKGIVDALFYGARKGDKYVGGCYGYPIYDDMGSVVVHVERVKH